jgi:hypothetical protein
MNQRISTATGLILIAAGVIALAGSFLGAVFGFKLWHLWPLTVIAAGVLVITPALFNANRANGKNRRGWLYIPGLPILTTGAILLFASVFQGWEVWSWLWPLEVIAVALGLLLGGLTLRAPGLFVPAIIIGANGMVLQFCALTGWWEAWAVLWSVEPVAVGLALLALNTRTKSTALMTVGLVLCAIGALGFMQSLVWVSFRTLRPLRWLGRWIMPLILMLIGGMLVGWNVIGKPASAQPTTIPTPAAPNEARTE